MVGEPGLDLRHASYHFPGKEPELVHGMKRKGVEELRKHGETQFYVGKALCKLEKWPFNRFRLNKVREPRLEKAEMLRRRVPGSVLLYCYSSAET